MNTLDSTGRRLLLGAAGVLLVAGATWAFTSSPAEEVVAIDFGETVTSVTPAFDAAAPEPVRAKVREFRVPITHDSVEIADGVDYEGWTFGGTVPGPAIRVTEGDLVRITLVNESSMGHSIDFHSARIPWNEAYRTIAPGEELVFEFEARDAGAYLVHCGTPPVTMHIMQGMYLPIIVDPKGGWGTEVDREFVLTQGEFYTRRGEDGAREMDYQAALDRAPSHVAFNGKAGQYGDHPLQVDEGDRVRLFVVNAGPSFASDFHVVGAVFDRVYPGSDPDQAIEGVQTWSVPAGGGAVFETTFEAGASGEGIYPFVTHAFADAEKGAVGMIRVGDPEETGGSH